MLPLDDNTARRLAEVIVDLGGPYEKKGYMLTPLLRNAGWEDPPEYDGSYRIQWLEEQLVARKHQHVEIESLLCRVCHPVEYDGGREESEAFRAAVNEKLEPEQLVINIVAGRPVLGELGDDGSVHHSVPENLESRLQKLLVEQWAVERLMMRARETQLCEQAGAHALAIIGIGSFVEGLLYRLFKERDSRKVKGRPRLNDLLNAAHENAWIQMAAKDFLHTVRLYRNFIHPAEDMEKKPDFSSETVGTCWAPVRLMLSDLEARLLPEG